MAEENHKKLELDNEWFCIDCINHNCINCDVMNNLLVIEEQEKTKKEVIDILKSDKKEEKNKNITYCDCWEKMIKSKFSNWPLYWCPICRWK